jgi:large repetitive protein
MEASALTAVFCALGLLCEQPTNASACERQLESAPDALCAYTAGAGQAVLIQGDIVLPSGLLSRGEVLISEDKILCTGCDCGDEAQARNAAVLSCPDAVVSPGLINGRVSSTFSTALPYTINQTYTHRHGWRTGAFGEQELTLVRPNTNLTDNVRWEEIRAVMAGSTSGVTSGSVVGMLRNLDRDTANGFGESRVRLETFPLGDSNGSTRISDCNYPNLPTSETFQRSDAYIINLAEGTRAEARNEFLCLSGGQTGAVDALGSPVAIAGGVALTEADIVSTVGKGTGLIWTARSDTALYKTTANVPVFKQQDANIALGTNWVASGSANLLRELGCADQWNRRWGGDVFSPAELVDLVTSNAASLTGFGAELGTLEVGKEADIVLWDTASGTRSGFDAILQAENKDVALVMRAGTPLYGNADLMTSLLPTDACETIDVCGQSKRICVEREFGETLQAIIGRNADSYPLFSCGAWSGEPSCAVN